VAGLKIHREAAGPGVLSALDTLGTVLSGRDFYVAGGTALALFEGHRISVDIDLFSKDIEDPEALLPRGPDCTRDHEYRLERKAA